MKRPIRMFSIAYGDKFLEWFEHACVNSLSWPKNRAALQAVETWDIWTTPQHAPRARAIAAKLGVPITMHPEMSGVREQLITGLVGQLDLCVKSKSSMLWVSPDSVFGDGTIRTLLDIGSAPGVCVALPPLRVNAEGFLQAMGPGPVSNARLVKIAFERLHQGFIDGEITKSLTNSFVSGVSWRTLEEGLYAVTHLLPSAYFLQPIESDVEWFRRKPKFGGYDHRFPQLLVEAQRQRVIGSSDAGFVVELTREGIDTPQITARDFMKPDNYCQDGAHIRANRNVMCIWRAE